MHFTMAELLLEESASFSSIDSQEEAVERVNRYGSKKIPNSSKEDHEFTKRSAQKKKKLQKFFGRSIPVDVSLLDIERLGLRAMLASRVPLCYFLYQLLEEHCSENLFFWLEVDLFEHTRWQSEDMMKDIATQLYDTFLRTDSEFEVNVPQKVTAPIMSLINSGHQNAFSAAREHIFKLLDSVFVKFKNGELYERMKKELGYTNVYDKRARNYGVKILLQNLDKNVPKSGQLEQGDPETFINMGNAPPPTTMAQERNDMIRAMLHAFCEMRLGIDFVDRDLEPAVVGKDEFSKAPAEDTFASQGPANVRQDVRIADANKELDSFAAYLDRM